MSSVATYAAQQRRLRQLGITMASLPPLRDIDTIADARAVARAFPCTAFAAALAAQGTHGR